jgi:cytochrome c oxidase subunit 2
MDSSFRLLPQQASDHATTVDHLTLFLVLVSVFFTLLIAVLVVYFAIHYRRRASGQHAHPQHAHAAGGREAEEHPEGHGMGLALEITWTVIPLILVTIMFLAGAKVFVRSQQPPRDATEIYVMGKRWMWHIQHLTGAREINELHVPVGKPIKLILISEDVIHDFGLPAFRMKQDVLPQRYTTEWFHPTEPGEYHIFCDQYCGVDHAKMVGTLYVMEPEKYRQWLEGRPTDEPPRLAGEKLYAQYGCVTCHSSRAPTMAGLYGRRVQLEGGRTVIADENYLRESILYPSAQVVAGFPPVMPSFKGQLTEDQVTDLVAYIKSLAGATSEPMALPAGNDAGPATQPTRATPGPGPFQRFEEPRGQP